MRADVFPSKNTFAQVNTHLLMPAIPALMDMEFSGIKVDMEMLKRFEGNKGYTGKLLYLTDKIRSYPEVRKLEAKLEHPFNIGSPDQVRTLLYNELGIPTEGLDLTDGGKVSVNKFVIPKIAKHHEIVELYKQYQKYNTLYKMFVKPLRKMITEQGRVHPSYMLNGTVTGRLSCEKPNIQQIPRNIDSDEMGFDFDTELNIKHLYIPSSKDHMFIQADYSQLELRVLAEYSEDYSMIKAFIDGVDIHLATATAITGDESLDKKSHWRRTAKTINFGIVYGKSPNTLADDLGISVKEANEFMDTYFSRMPDVKKFIEDVKRFCREHLYVTSMFGRLRRIPAIVAKDKWIRFESERQSVNAPIQSTASDYTLSALIILSEMFRKYRLKSKIVAIIHDSLLVDALRKEHDIVTEMMETVMTAPDNKLIYWSNKVPLKADFEESDDRWSNLKAV